MTLDRTARVVAYDAFHRVFAKLTTAQFVELAAEPFLVAEARRYVADAYPGACRGA